MLLEEKLAVFASWGYQPNDEQLKVHADPSLVKVVAGGERSLKSFVTGNEIAAHAAADSSLVWAIGPDYEQTHKEFDYALEALTKIGAVIASSVHRPERSSAASSSARASGTSSRAWRSDVGMLPTGNICETSAASITRCA